MMKKTTDTRQKDVFETQVRKAKNVLDQNWAGTFTKPAPHLYPFQWSWDSAFITIGYAHYNQQRAETELRTLFNSQWSNGLLPQIIFHDSVHSESYFPGPDFWQTELLAHAPDNPKTSGICQPPIHATALLHLLKFASDSRRAETFAAELFPKLNAWHSFLYRERDPAGEGLVYIRHPWGSGQDNSPLWDDVLGRMKLRPDQIPVYQRKDIELIHVDERPSDLEYDRYVYLLDFFRKRGYDEEQVRKDGCPFLIQDVLFNTLLCRAERDLAEIARFIGENPQPFLSRVEKTSRAINSKLWDDEHNTYVDFDLNTDRQIHAHVLAGFMPLFAGIPDETRAQRMFEYLNTNCFCRLDDPCYAAPSYDRNAEGYSKSQYWRGPIWINMNWMLEEGLERYGFTAYSHKIRRSIMQLTQRCGFHEYFDPDDGKGYGSDQFSWTAALLIDVISKYRDIRPLLEGEQDRF